MLVVTTGSLAKVLVLCTISVMMCCIKPYWNDCSIGLRQYSRTKKKASTLKKAENRQVDESLLQGKDMYFVFQGYAPTKEQLAAGEYTMSRFAKLYGMNYKGMTTE